MKTKISTSVLLWLLILSNGFSQDKGRKESKEEHKIEVQKRIDSLINSKVFVFVASMAYPQGNKAMNLTTNINFIKFSPELIVSELPFYGRAYNVAYGGDGGMKFQGKPEEYTVVKRKKDYLIKAVVKGNNDSYQIFLTVSFEGSSSLSINSNNRSSISYSGDISAPEKQK